MAGFFSVTQGHTEEELIDLYARRYGWTVREILDTDAGVFMKLYAKAVLGEKRDEAKAEWNACLPFMLMHGKFLPFDRYFSQATGMNVDRRPAEDILKEVSEIRKEIGEANGSI